MITIWYMDHEAFRESCGGMNMTTQLARKLKDAGRYQKAAEMDGDDLEEAYKIMQNGVVTPSWTLEPPTGFRPIMPPRQMNGVAYGNRSACCGDIFEVDGKLYLCATVGFKEIEAA